MAKTMIVMSDAEFPLNVNLEQAEGCGEPRSKATMIARLMRVIMPGLRSASSPHAPRMKRAARHRRNDCSEDGGQ